MSEVIYIVLLIALVVIMVCLICWWWWRQRLMTTQHRTRVHSPAKVMEEELSQHFRSNGLEDCDFWLPIFKSIGVESRASFTLIEHDTDQYSKLIAKARNSVEKKALYKLLKIDEVEKHAEEQKKKKAQKRREIRDNWREKKRKKYETEEQEQKEVKETGQLQQRDWLCGTNLLMKCSGGRALKGILLTKKISDQLEEKSHRLLEIPQNVVLTGASLSEDTIKHFSLENQEDEYKKAVDVFGYSVAMSSEIPVYGNFSVNLGPSRGEDKSTHKIHTEETYSSTVKYSSIEVANFTFENKDLKLSEDAITELKQICKTLKSDGIESERVQEACKQFFHQYGSHANRGPLKFGGNFWWTCSSRGFHKQETETVKHMQSAAISINAGLSFAGFGFSTSVNIEKTKDSYKDMCSPQTLDRTTLKVKITGGPPEATNLDLWKSGLVASNKTWILTDRGRKLIAVWEIIRLNHNKELGEIVGVLRNTWEKMTGLQADKDYSVTLTHNPVTVLSEVSEWIIDEDMGPEEIETNLQYLLAIRRDIIKETSPKFWVGEFLLQPSLCDYLLLIVNSELESSYHDRIKFLMQQLIEKDELSQMLIHNDRNIESISKWLYELSQQPKQIDVFSKILDFESFIKFLKKTLDNERIADLNAESFERKEAQRKLAINVSKAINHLRCHYKLKYDDIFIVALVYPFTEGAIDTITLKPITLKELESLNERFSEQQKNFSEYVTKQILNLQAFLLQLAIDYCGEETLEPLLHYIIEQMDKIQPPLEKELLEKLDDYFYGYTSVKPNLRTFMTSSPLTELHLIATREGDTDQSLRNILNTPPLLEKKLPTKSLSIVCEQSPNAYALLKKLGLCDHYPKGLQLKDALCIKQEPLAQSLDNITPIDPKKLPDLVLHKLMSYDSFCRTGLMPREENNESNNSDTEEESDNESVSDKQSDEESESGKVKLSENLVPREQSKESNKFDTKEEGEDRSVSDKQSDKDSQNGKVKLTENLVPREQSKESNKFDTKEEGEDKSVSDKQSDKDSQSGKVKLPENLVPREQSKESNKFATKEEGEDKSVSDKQSDKDSQSGKVKLPENLVPREQSKESNKFDTKEESEDKSVNDKQSDKDSQSGKVKLSITECSGIHPVDSLLSLILCSDDFLRQDLFSRLAKCQLAVPLILPDPFTKELTLPLWGLRSIIKEWDCRSTGAWQVKKTQPIINYPTAIVTFIRLGKHQEHVRSKSAILNEVISNSHYDHFFHRDCKGGDYDLILGQGLVDMCWYLPGETSDSFPDAVTFLNLHGDARRYSEQTRFLSHISSMCFVLVTEENLQLNEDSTYSLKQFASSAGGITLLGGIKTMPKILRKKYLIDLNKLNISRIKEAIRNRIKKKINFSKSFNSIEDHCDPEKNKLGEILLDECSEVYKQGSSHANRVTKILIANENPDSDPKRSNSSLKDQFLPLQGKELWKSWAIKDKEVHRQIHRGDKPVNIYTDDIDGEKDNIRRDQLTHVKTLTPVMKTFITSLLRLEGSSNQTLRNYFLHCLKLELNTISRESISDMKYQYHSTRKELCIFQEDTASKKDSHTIDKVNLLKEKLEILQERIICSSFGLEHLFRELGQVYEAAHFQTQHAKVNPYGDSLYRLPKAAAELLIDGYPLELMDGDAAHVPLRWVTAVLQEAIKMLNNPNVFVLSVLGLQSTGKSTMLNATFGLQFNVSAGRCTCGAFIQLLPLDNELKKQTNCSYVLVVDTEGLRAPELDLIKTQKHDNELATFVIGLANMTLINFYGEVPGDMDDILQTSVHAFLRMTEIKFNPSCQFVHQNAGASVRSDVGRAKFTARLNRFTIQAARHEKREEIFKCFNDVIKFNDETDVHHFPGLWMGDPPMAPVNQGYSQSAQMLKSHLIERLCRRPLFGETVGDLHLSAFKTKVNDLWESLLKENFVFSFKNTQEITAYNSLEVQYSCWAWELQEAMINWERVAENEFKAAKSEAVSNLATKKLGQLLPHMSSLHKPIKEKMNAFFSGEQSEILVQWKAKFELRLNNLVDDLRTHAENHCKKLAKSKLAISKFEEEKKSYTAMIRLKVQEHIDSIKQEQEKLHKSLSKGKLGPDQLKIIFRKKLFTPDKVKQYKEKGIITEEQAKRLEDIKCTDQRTLKEILYGEILSLSQVKQILIERGETEEELETNFNDIWIDLIEGLPPLSGDTVDIEHEVEETLIEFARSISYEGQLVELLQKTPLKDWSAHLEFVPKVNTHYTKVCNTLESIYSHFYFLRGKSRATNDPYLIAALSVTTSVFDEVKEYLEHITGEQTDFKSAFAQELLHKVENAIAQKSKEHSKVITFILKYRLYMFILVCRYAIPKFEKMAREFAEQTDPRLYLEKNQKKPLLTLFKTQYYQTKAEETIASTLCAYLEAPIKNQINQTIGTIMVTKMKASRHHFTSKMALKVKVLSDLYAENDYESFMTYIRDVGTCLQTKIRRYTVQYSDELITGETRLQIAAKEEVSRLITATESVVTRVNDTEIEQWLKTFSEDENIVEQLGGIDVDNLLIGFKSITKIDLPNFKHQVRHRLTKLKEALHAHYATIDCETYMKDWKDKPHDLLADLIGCTAQCPFCLEQCDLRDPNHYKNSNTKHRTGVHRPDCLGGWRDSNTKIMCTNFCPASVASELTFRSNKTNHTPHPYRKYNTIYPEWSIPPDPSSANSLYWKWFVGKYSKELATTYDAKPADVPKGWLKYEGPQIINNLHEVYET